MSVKEILDLFINIICIIGLAALAVRARIAFDQHKWGRTAFCVMFSLTVLRSLALRWLTGATPSGVKPDIDFVAFLSNPIFFLVLYTLLLASLVWVTLEELKEFRAQRKLRKLAKAQIETLRDKDKEIDRLNQKATLEGAAPESAWPHPWPSPGTERRKLNRIEKDEKRNDYGLHA